jgi:hypothetical protein
MSQQLSLREEDYETIHTAVMETARGRWFLNEYARRNRSADTQTVIEAIAALEKKLGTAPSATAGNPVKQQILAAAEDVQEAAWALRELGANPDYCARLDRNAADISACLSQELGADGTDLLEEDVIDDENDALPAASTLIEAQSLDLPKSSLPQIQTRLATEWPVNKNEETAKPLSHPGFSLSNYCFEEKIALFS